MYEDGLTGKRACRGGYVPEFALIHCRDKMGAIGSARQVFKKITFGKFGHNFQLCLFQSRSLRILLVCRRHCFRSRNSECIQQCANAEIAADEYQHFHQTLIAKDFSRGRVTHIIHRVFGNEAICESLCKQFVFIQPSGICPETSESICSFVRPTFAATAECAYNS